MKFLKSIAAVIAGYAIFVISAVALFQLSGYDPHSDQPLWFRVAAGTYGMVFAGLGGRAAARIAPARPALHTGITALLIVGGASASLLTSPVTDATWSMWQAILLMAPCCWAAGLKLGHQ